MRTEGADRVDELRGGSLERPASEADDDEEQLEAALLAYAHQEATRWGAERFAAEFERRDEEERRLTGAGTPPFRYPWEPDEIAPPPSSVLSGLVDAAVQEQVIRADPAELDLVEPPKIRHAHVPRPAPPEPEAPRRARRLRRERAVPQRASVISQAEAARMSPSARRLYGLEPLPSVDPRRA
ncbi:MAG: hypothetical protein E6G37_01215 [Actinobacteria bacterium]|nr:MAG: hypothetical protein E6G63_06975 [Actinomycetota bacterium]TMK22361.1 MAG: hypothetical protein E6G65_02805 [Actinomycetota bacterium]TMK95034.1 MAG: hypothetical protein E6G37_01215 [Actinomycetota bacterium]TMM21451.1 MAG: hypothetical protein E6F95_11240 [Actinomycetota bacterium]HYX10824.1 hypothetical protein [Candidatus Acidoferrum sp.]